VYHVIRIGESISVSDMATACNPNLALFTFVSTAIFEIRYTKIPRTDLFPNPNVKRTNPITV
jgi:hypothetical protein